MFMPTIGLRDRVRVDFKVCIQGWGLTRVQASMRDLDSPMSCCHIAVGGYSGTPLSLSSRKRWLRGSLSASRSSCRSMMLVLGLPHTVCATVTISVVSDSQHEVKDRVPGWHCWQGAEAEVMRRSIQQTGSRANTVSAPTKTCTVWQQGRASRRCMA